MAKHRSIVIIYLIVLELARICATPPEYPRSGRDLRGNRLPKQQDDVKALKRRVPRQIRTSDERFEESSMRDANATRWQFEVAPPIPLKVTSENEEASRYEANENMWIMATEVLRKLEDEYENDRLKLTKLADPGVEAHRNDSGKYETSVATTEGVNVTTVAMSEDPAQREAAQRKQRKREYDREHNKHRRERQLVARRENPELIEACREKQREYSKRYRERQKKAQLENRQLSEAQRKQWRESKQRRKARLQFAKENPVIAEPHRQCQAEARLESSEAAEARRNRKRENLKRCRERQRAARLENPKAGETQRKRKRAYEKCYRERLRAARLENPEAAEEERKRQREYQKRHRERLKAARSEKPEVAVENSSVPIRG